LRVTAITCAQVLHFGEAGYLPVLEELHLCSNKIVTFDRYGRHRAAAGRLVDQRAPSVIRAVRRAGAAPSKVRERYMCFKELKLLNLSSNEIADWGEVDRFCALPKCADSAAAAARAVTPVIHRVRSRAAPFVQAGAAACQRQSAHNALVHAENGRCAPPRATARALAHRQRAARCRGEGPVGAPELDLPGQQPSPVFQCARGRSHACHARATACDTPLLRRSRVRQPQDLVELNAFPALREARFQQNPVRRARARVLGCLAPGTLV
jgi:hypothetical protein